MKPPAVHSILCECGQVCILHTSRSTETNIGEDHGHLHCSDSRAFPDPVEKYRLEAVSEPCVLFNCTWNIKEEAGKEVRCFTFVASGYRMSTN